MVQIGCQRRDTLLEKTELRGRYFSSLHDLVLSHTSRDILLHEFSKEESKGIKEI